MKKHASLIVAAVWAFAPVVCAQDAEETVTGLLPNQQDFLNLPEESRKDFVNHIGEASRMFQQKRIFEALERLEKAGTIFEASPEVYNLRGSCYVEMRAFEKALREFGEASALSRDNPSIEFNIAEVLFVTKQWQKSLEAFEKVLLKIPEQNTALARLVEFKILLCLKKVGRADDAVILAEKYDFMDDSPFHYYAQAALAYDDNRLVEAEQWLARAARVFQNPDIIAPWQDTLIEFGYIKSFYGEDLAAGEEE
jgi:tetratricopeptide (TPR) repeat protein